MATNVYLEILHSNAMTSLPRIKGTVQIAGMPLFKDFGTIFFIIRTWGRQEFPNLLRDGKKFK